ncbi:MAG: hypothetical protein K9M96_16140 [Deltaproteobacteria bacterium]|nr:hypothetical protein [Deltaproteobacteria bacterium]
MLKHKVLAQVMVVFAFLCFTAPGFAGSPFAGRILPTEKVDFFSDGKQVGQYTAEAPLPWDTRVVCKGRTGLEMDDMFLVFEDGTSFTLSQKNGSPVLNVQKGTAYFALPTLPKGLEFAIPQDTVVTEMMTLNAAATGGRQLLKGYVKAGKEASELGVIEGGSLMVDTAEGKRTIKSGERIILAQAKTAGGGGAGGGGTSVSTAAILGTIAGVGAAIGLSIASYNSRDDDEGSPFTP